MFRKTLKILINILAIILFFPLHLSGAQDEPVDDSFELTKRFFHYLGQNSFLKAAGLFYYPSNYTHDELLNKKLSVIKTFMEAKGISVIPCV